MLNARRLLAAAVLLCACKRSPESATASEVATPPAGAGALTVEQAADVICQSNCACVGGYSCKPQSVSDCKAAKVELHGTEGFSAVACAECRQRLACDKVKLGGCDNVCAFDTFGQ